MDVALAVFGAQSKSPSAEYLDSIRSFIQGHPFLQYLLEEIKTLEAVWDHIRQANANVESLTNGPRFTRCIIDWLVDGKSESVASILSGIVSLPRLAIVQFAQYFNFLAQEGLSHSQFVANAAASGGIQGFCGGLPAAIALASAVDDDELKQSISTVIRIAYAIGVYAEFGDDSDAPGVTTMVVRLKEEGQAEELIKDLPGASVYISALTDPKSVSIVGPAEQLAILQERLREQHMLSQAIDIRGKTHNPENAALGRQLIEHCRTTPLLDMGDSSRLQTLVRSNKAGVRRLEGSLTEELVTTILCDRCEWYELLTAAATDIKAARRSTISIACFGIGDCTPLMPFHKQGLTVSKRQWTAVPDSERKPAADFVPHFPDDAVAIVGASCRFPGANNLEEYWRLMAEGKDMHQEVPVGRLDVHGSHRASLSGDFTRKRKFYGNFVHDADRFDHAFFGISAREAVNMDPQQRMLLELGYEAMETSGYMRHHNRTRGDNVGCFIGASFVEYLDNTSCHAPTAYTSTGTIRAFLCGRLSSYFGWTGPAEVIDTACSSSLVAVNRAVRAIRNGECSSALVGGVNVMSGITNFMDLGRAGFLSPTGQCKPFDAAGDGYCRSEGGALIFLKPLSKAQESGDNILGVLCGAGTNQGGLSPALTVPHSDALSELYTSLLEQAKLSSDAVSYVEAHGTGTQAGDPVEIESIRRVFGTNRQSVLHIGSVKGNIGHAETAAGIAGLIKVICMLAKRSIPPQASHTKWNPKIPPLSTNRIALSTHLQPWKEVQGSPRAALVNSYGAAGSNAAVLCCQAPPPKEGDKLEMLAPETCSYPIIISAKTVESLKAYQASLSSSLKQANPAPDISKVAYTLSHLRPRYRHSAIFENVRDVQDLILSLDTRVANTHSSETPGSTVLLFSGQSKQLVGLARNLYERQAVFRSRLDVCDATLRDLGYPSIIPSVFQLEDVEDIVVLQSGLAAVQYCMATCWMEAGVSVSAVVGHSLGELAALAVSRVLSLEDCLKLVAARATLIKSLCGPKGSMMAVAASRETVQQVLDATKLPLDIACFNARNSQVVAGDTAAIEKLETYLRDQSLHQVKTRRINTTHAFHSRILDPILVALDEVAATLEWREPMVPIYLCKPDVQSPDVYYPSSHARNPVYFQDTLERLQHDLGSCNWIEIGVDSPFLTMAKQVLDPKLEHRFHTMSTTAKVGAATADMLAPTICSLWRTGMNVSYWQFLNVSSAEGSVWLPPYQFDGKSMWLDNVDHAAKLQRKIEGLPQTAITRDDASAPRTRLVVPLAASKSSTLHFRISPDSERFRGIVSGHAVRNRPLCPASVYMECVTMALGLATGDTKIRPEFSHLEMQAPLGLASSDMEVQLKEAAHNTWAFSVTSSPANNTSNKRTLHAQGSVCLDSRALAKLGVAARFAQRRVQELQRRTDGEKLLAKRAYSLFSRVVSYADFLKGISSISLYEFEAISTIHGQPGQPAQDESTAISTCEAVAMDNFIQVVGLLVNTSDLVAANEVMVCTAVESSETSSFCDFGTTKSWTVYASFTPLTSSRASGDVFVFLPDGSLAAALTGCQFTKLEMSRLERALDSASKQPSAVPHAKSPRPQDAMAQLADTRPETKPNVKKDVSINVSAASSSTASTAQSCVEGDPLLSLLERYTGADPASVSDSMTFTDAGLDSLAAIEFCSELASSWQIELDPSDLLLIEVGALRRKLPNCTVETGETSPIDQSDGDSYPAVEEENKYLSSHDSNVEAAVVSLIAEITGAVPDSLKHQMTLADVGVDSLAMIELGAGLPAPASEAVENGIITLDSTIGEVLRAGAATGISAKQPQAERAADGEIDQMGKAPSLSSSSVSTADKSAQLHGKDPPTPLGPFDIPRALLTCEDALPEAAMEHGFSHYWCDVVPKQNELVLAYIREAFLKLGIDLNGLPVGTKVPDLRHHARFGRLVERLWEILAANKVVEMTSAGPAICERATILTKSSAAICEELAQQYPEYGIETRLMSLTGPMLAECISGEVEATTLLFGTQDAARVLEEYYASSPVLATATAQLVTFVTTLLDKMPGTMSTIRILEVGAGTGGTTGPLLEDLIRRNVKVEYTFTDISPSLIAKAKRKFAKYDKYLRFARLDLENDSSYAQLAAPFDIVLGTNCVHATKDRAAVCSKIRKILSPTGVMVLSEITRVIDWYDLVFGLLDGWWLSPSYPLQSGENWMQVYAEAGFESSTFSVGSTADLNTQQLLIGSKMRLPTGINRTKSQGKRGPTLQKQTMVYKTIDGLDVEADVYLPGAPPVESMPIAVLLHGGGHMTLSRRAIRPWQISLLLSHGVLPVSFDYRLAPEVNIIDGAMEDVRDAVTWSRTVLPPILADQNIKLNSDKVVIVGWSSGGHLAMSTAWTLAGKGLQAPNAILSFYAPVNFLGDDLFPRNEMSAVGTLPREKLLQSELQSTPLTNYTPRGGEEPDLGWIKSGDPRSECLLSLFRGGKESLDFGLSLMLSGRLDQHRTIGDVVNECPTHGRRTLVCPTAQLRAGNYKVPTYIIHGDADNIAPFSSALAFHEEMARQGLKSGFTAVANGKHIHDLRLTPESPKWSCEVAPGYAFLFEELGI